MTKIVSGEKADGLEMDAGSASGIWATITLNLFVLFYFLSET
jgi:hypothetical protein